MRGSIIKSQLPIKQTVVLQRCMDTGYYVRVCQNMIRVQIACSCLTLPVKVALVIITQPKI